jgi:uridine kinase
LTHSPYIIGIAGGTGSGKTTVAKKVVEGLPPGEAALIQHDWYYKDLSELTYEARARVNYDEPASLDNELLAHHLRALHAGEAIDAPQYDFTTHLRTAGQRRITPAGIIVVEGILLFAVAALREQFDLLLFVDTDDDIRLMRRIKRDIIDRGRDISSIQSQYYKTVRPMHRLHVAPTRSYAHLIIPEGGENRQAVEVIVGRLLHLLST